jgi:hypothetical protein
MRSRVPDPGRYAQRRLRGGKSLPHRGPRRTHPPCQRPPASSRFARTASESALLMVVCVQRASESSIAGVAPPPQHPDADRATRDRLREPIPAMNSQRISEPYACHHAASKHSRFTRTAPRRQQDSRRRAHSSASRSLENSVLDGGTFPRSRHALTRMGDQPTTGSTWGDMGNFRIP